MWQVNAYPENNTLDEGTNATSLGPQSVLVIELALVAGQHESELIKHESSLLHMPQVFTENDWMVLGWT